ncbi:hypothetical protein LDENG_00168410 [Lucifuga dentata]|nr:hypothetical protein LDENG_00168410 [Lucifuga dentata]
MGEKKEEKTLRASKMQASLPVSSVECAAHTVQPPAEGAAHIQPLTLLYLLYSLYSLSSTHSLLTLLYSLSSHRLLLNW